MAPLVIDVDNSDDPRDVVHRAVQALVEGKLVAFPTETVYVAAASALHEDAVERLIKLRQGDLDGPLVMAVRSADDALDYVPRIPPLGMRLARRCWPGPVTLELEDAQPESVVQRLPESVRARVAPLGNIRLRVPAHDLIAAVLRLLAGPLVMIGARRHDQGDAVTAKDVVDRFGAEMDVVLDDGRCKFAQRSSIVRIADAKFEIVRPGVISATNLKRLASWIAVTVCTGNTCRSPMAETLLRHKLAKKVGCKIDELEDRGVIVMSAGISATTGGRSAAEAATVMQERGLDLSLHESQPLNDRIVRFADLILTMTRSHREAILSQWPDAAPRTHLISQSRGDVADPIGGPIDLYRRCADQIDAYLENWVRTIDLGNPS